MSSTDGANVSAEAMERELNAKTRQLESLAIQQKKKEVIFSTGSFFVHFAMVYWLQRCRKTELFP